MTADVTTLKVPTMIDNVAAFMAACDHKPHNEESWELYWNLSGEELNELMQASGLEEELDAICDSVWCLLGYGLARGYDMNKAWEEVTRSNMAKIHADGKVHKRYDGKVEKPEGWVPPDLSECMPQTV
jgi:predicted HAD superfamily Cof-like phosphohydrolase